MIRDPDLRHAVEIGLLPEDIAQEADDYTDVLTTRIVRGELTAEEGDALASLRAAQDAERASKRGYPIGKAREFCDRAAGKPS
jgi:hypothetical protein